MATFWDDPEHYDPTPAVNLWFDHVDSTVNPHRPHARSHAKKYKKIAQLANSDNFESDSTDSTNQ